MVTVSDFNKGKAGGNVGARRRSKPTGSPGYTPPSVRREQSKKSVIFFIFSGFFS